jgi:hypothetical protein
MIRKLSAILFATAFLAGGCGVAVAAPAQKAVNTTQVSALAPGGAAGVKEAQGWASSNTVLWVAGGAVVVGGVALIASGNGNGHHTSATGSTNP